MHFRFRLGLFPAYAGVILEQKRLQLESQAFPRLRGGDPDLIDIDVIASTFSPPTRG